MVRRPERCGPAPPRASTSIQALFQRKGKGYGQYRDSGGSGPGRARPGDGERRASTVNHSVMVGAVGNFVECFDWFAYALFASYISRQVFPAGDPLAGLLSTFAIFAVGFFVRPVGSFIFGIYTDRHGRKNALAATIFLMAAGSLMIAVVPTFALAGWLSPAMLIAARLLQGWPWAGRPRRAAAIVEASPARHRASAAAFHISVGLGNAVGLAGGFLADAAATPAQMESFGWRLVFVLGSALGLFDCTCGVREESELFLQVAKTTRKQDRGSLRVVAAEYWPGMLRLSCWPSVQPWRSISGSAMCRTSCAPKTLCPRPPPLGEHAGPDRSHAACPSAARCPTGSAAAWCLACRGWSSRLLAPMMRYVMADAGSLPWVTCAAMALIGLGSAVAAGFAEQFPTRVRAIGWGAPYNISIAVFGARRLTWAHGSPARAGRIVQRLHRRALRPERAGGVRPA